MSANLEEILARLEQLEAREQIRELKARYLRGCDLKQVEDIRQTMLPDVIVDYEGFTPFSDREAFLDVYQQMACQEGVYDIHHAANGVITFTGPDEALGQWSLNFRSVILPLQMVTQLGVEYDDRYVRIDGQWYIAETRSRRTSCITEKVDAEGRSHYIALGDANAAYGAEAVEA